MKCQACNGPEAESRELWMIVGHIELGVRAELCASCAATAPDRIRKELSSPLIRSIVNVMGARLGFSGGNGTPSAPSSPGAGA